MNRPPEVAVASHGQYTAPAKQGTVEAWLNPERNTLPDALEEILKDK
ncbi:MULTISPECIES: hypothetical protein [Ralstonia]|nr:hypothetical protein [Ralstonia pickettii]MCM3581853.1 hypothetical protein [Ralstonia pickettii]